MHTLIDPTYLRYIVDGLGNQSIHQENLSALPQGLIGIYDEALSCEQQIQYRTKILEFLSALALLKKEVSACFISHLLKWQDQEVIYTLNIYTKWFNSPTSGTYILYHERLRAYLLSKIPSNQLNDTNHKIITSCQQALESKKGDEWEIYALEHLPSHLLNTAMQDKEQGDIFRKLVYDTSNWIRQLEISKGYDWSKKMLNQALTWAAKQGTDELVECALNKIDLHYMEQNDAPRIVELVAQNDMETALQRIESFGGNDKEGLQRKFTLYMLCLMELTLLDSKDKPFRKSAIEKLLIHLDENIPVDHSLLNWNDFFPSYLIFLIAAECNILGFDYLIIFKFTDYWEYEWIEEFNNYSDSYLEILFHAVFKIKDNYLRSSAMISISSIFFKKGDTKKSSLLINEAFQSAYDINYESYKIKALLAIANKLSAQNKFKEAKSAIQDSLKFAREISFERDKCDSLLTIANELSIHGEKKQANYLIKEAFDCCTKINEISFKNEIQSNISYSLAISGKFNIAIKLAKGISDEFYKNSAFSNISSVLAKKGKIDEAIINANTIADISNRCRALHTISFELAKNNEFDYSLNLARRINDNYELSSVLTFIASELNKKGQENLSLLIRYEALECARGIEDGYERWNALKNIAKNLFQNGRVQECFAVIKDAQEFALNNMEQDQKNNTLLNIADQLSRYQKVSESTLLFFEILKYNIGVNNQGYRNIMLSDIARQLVQKDRLDDAFICIKEMSPIYNKLDVISLIAIKLINKDKLENAIKCITDINNDYNKTIVYSSVVDHLINQKKYSEAESVLLQLLDLSRSISNNYNRSKALLDIANRYLKLNNTEFSNLVMKEAIESSLQISDAIYKSSSLSAISIKLAEINQLNYALECTLDMGDYLRKTITLIKIASITLREGNIDQSVMLIDESLKTIFHIEDQYDKISALIFLSSELQKQRNSELSISLMKEAQEYANIIEDDYQKSTSLKNIAVEYFKQGRIKESQLVLNEAIEIALQIIDVNEKSSSLLYISDELVKNGGANNIFSIGLLIPNILDRQECWKNISKIKIQQIGCINALLNDSIFPTEEAKIFYFKGWTESITVDDISDELAHKSIKALKDDSISLEKFLQIYAQHELFFSNPSKEKIGRLNKSLNLEWVLDIIDQFPKE